MQAKEVSYYSHGKLLLSGEYTVLDGALALALPTQLGQDLRVTTGAAHELSWQAYDCDKQVWYQGIFYANKIGLQIKEDTDSATSKTLIALLNACNQQQPGFITSILGHRVRTTLEFPRDWGLGSSSTLISNLALWAQIDPYQLLWDAFGGSGYDIACATAAGPILYQTKQQQVQTTPLFFDPPFKADIFFVHLNQKQNSREAILNYRKKEIAPSAIAYITQLTKAISEARSLEVFKKLLNEHESYMGTLLEVATVKERLFKDYPGSLKSLGAWGGDFILATGKEALHYFPSKGYKTVVPYADIIL